MAGHAISVLCNAHNIANSDREVDLDFGASNDAQRGQAGTTTSRPASQALAHGRYELREFVGKGGMGAIYRAYDVELDRWVAVKCFLDGTGESSRERASQEARTLASLSHANIMRVFDILNEGEQVLIVSEWLEGQSLAQIQLPLPASSVLAVMAQIYDALAAAHAVGVIHRDIKPSNVMIGSDGRVTLIDFGVAFAPGRSTGETLAGSLRYTDPRILEGEPPDALSDLYSAALLQVELMTGEPALPDLAPLPLHRYIKKHLDRRLEAQLDGAYPPLAALARRFTARRRMLEDGAASEAAALMLDSLRRLTPETPAQYLGAGLCRGFPEDAQVQARFADETRSMLADPQLTPKEKATWIAFQATGEASSDKALPRRARGVPNTVYARLAGAARLGRMPRPTERPWLSLAVGGVLILMLTFLGLVHKSPQSPQDAGEAPQPQPTVPAEVASVVSPPALLQRPLPTPGLAASASVAPKASETAADTVPVHLVANAWATVMLDGQKAGRLPQAAPFLLTPGHHTLELENPAVEPLATDIKVQPGKPQRLHFKLHPRMTARVFKLARPGRLFVDGHDHGVVTTKRLKMSYGTHRVWVKRGRKSGPPRSIALGPGSPTEIRLE